jgi:hypothetical protein
MQDLEKCLPASQALVQVPEPAHFSRKGESGYEHGTRSGHRDSTTTSAQSLNPTPLDDTLVHEERFDDRWRARLAVLGAFLALFCTFGQMNAFGTFQTYYHSHQLSDYPASTISWIGSLQLWIFFFSVWKPLLESSETLTTYDPREAPSAGFSTYMDPSL